MQLTFRNRNIPKFFGAVTIVLFAFLLPRLFIQDSNKSEITFTEPDGSVSIESILPTNPQALQSYITELRFALLEAEKRWELRNQKSPNEVLMRLIQSLPVPHEDAGFTGFTLNRDNALERALGSAEKVPRGCSKEKVYAYYVLQYFHSEILQNRTLDPHRLLVGKSPEVLRDVDLSTRSTFFSDLYNWDRFSEGCQ